MFLVELDADGPQIFADAVEMFLAELIVDGLPTAVEVAGILPVVQVGVE